jgi:nitrogen fixation/metabolism regulation signal transduction histidine kinase
MNKSARWTWAISAIALVGVVLVLFFVLSLTTQEPAHYQRYFVWLFWVNVAVAGLLVLVIGIAAVRLGFRLRSGKFGSRLLVKLAGIFALVGVLPGVLIYTVSYQFVSRSIEIWFDTRVESALDAGLNLGKGTLDAMSTDLANKTRNAADSLIDTRGPAMLVTLERLREQLGAQDVALLGNNGQVLLMAGSSAAIAPDRPSQALLRQARQSHAASQIEGLEDELVPGEGDGPQARVRALALVPSLDFTLLPKEERFLLVVQNVPRALSRNALVVQSAYREYQQRALAREGLRRMYIGTLTLSLVLAVFGAVLLAVVLGNQLARPLLLLAQGMRQVAAGDLGAKPVFASRDEIGGLTRSFAAMTEQLGAAREHADASLRQLEAARTRLQTILDNLTAGVIMFDRQRGIDTVNPGATRILRVPLAFYVGHALTDIPELQDFAQAVWQRFDAHQASPEAAERDHWQDAFEVKVGEQGDTLTLLVRGAMLPGLARLMVFDDITEVVSAQRSAAWSEVARRLAHEIKNPLTPIQLSAERLQHKLASHLGDADQALLTRSVATIVHQVESMKQLVNEFRDYARLPAAQLAPVDLNALVSDVLALYGEAQEHGTLATRSEPGLPWVLGDATQLRQVVHNLVQNGLDAVGTRANAQVLLQTEATRHPDGRIRSVQLKVIDNGGGFADKVLQRAFEPYVTTKSKGTGLGLAVVKKIADEHSARVRIVNLPGPDGLAGASVGAQVSLSFSKFTDMRAPPAPGAAAPRNDT